MADFKKGDVVQLKSGGPLMTVVETGLEENKVHVQFFAGAEFRDLYIEPAALNLHN